ncbi:MAG TPA: hypothetical protein VHB98_10985 [Chloroflexota bacterium]|nr:hypothetical protein [Chloroflexota bacterium]
MQQESWPLFFSRLDAADADLAVAADLMPDDPGPWVLMITTARGRQLGIPEVRRRFAEVERRYPHHPQACQQILQAVAAKWGGSHELMFEFARGVSARAPMGSAVHAVIPEAHYEFWAAEKDDQKGYWQRPDVRSEILEASRRCFTNASPAPRTVLAGNMFAFTYLLMGEATLLSEQFDQTGGIVTEPWSLLPNPTSLIAKTRASATARQAYP